MTRAPVAGDLVAGRYELEELVGSGGMSSVFRARDRQLERPVALKILHERYADDGEYVERFRREARAVAQLAHPNIVTVIDRGEDEGRQFIVFEYVDGENLKELVLRSGRLPLRRALELALAVADGLAFAHESGLVHRDVKPQNVLLSGEGEVKVTDFGIARSLGDHGMTQTGTVLGTSNYLSPEQASGKPVSPATDVYALGVVLWELLTGEVPFPGDNFVAVALRHINERPPPLRKLRLDVPPRLAAAVERALEKEPRRRFPTMAAFAEELRACLAALEEEDTAARLAPALVPPVGRLHVRGRRRAVAYAVAPLAAGAVLAGVLLLGGSSHGKGGPRGGATVGGAAVKLEGLTTYDPQGDGSEPALGRKTAPLATDGNSATYWQTETYATQGWGNLKSGLGLVLEAGSPVQLARVTVVPTATGAGFVARIEVGAAPGGPFAVDSFSQTVAGRTTFTLDGKSGRYWMVWLSRLGRARTAQISEVTASR